MSRPPVREVEARTGLLVEDAAAVADTAAAAALAIIRLSSSSAHSFWASESCCCCSSVSFCPDAPPSSEEKVLAAVLEATEVEVCCGCCCGCCLTGVGLATGFDTGLAVMVTSGFPLAASAAAASAFSFCCLALLAAARTSAMLLLKVSGIALEPCSPEELLNSWLLLLLDWPAEEADDAEAVFFIPVVDALWEVFPKRGPLTTLGGFFPGGSFRSCSRFD